jgi:hypothetical protein
VQTIASFWQVVGWIAGFVIIGAAVGFAMWRRRRRVARVRHLTLAPPPAPAKPNGEDRSA